MKTKLPDQNYFSISVVITAFNYGQYLADAIESALAQSLKPYEIIVVDDGSTDDTARICKRYGQSITYLYQENQGEASARNTGLKESNGEFLAFLDADDVWLPDALELLLSSFQVSTGAMISVGHSQEIVESADGWRSDQNPYVGIHLSAVMIRRLTFDRAGSFNEELRSAIDTDWLFRVRENDLTIACIDQTVVKYRRHQSNATLCDEMLRTGLLSACRASLGRRRVRRLDPFLSPFGFRRSLI